LRGGIIVAAFCALHDCGKTVKAKLVDSAGEAEQISRCGLLRLFALRNDKQLRTQVSNLPGYNQAALQLSSLIGSQELQTCLRDLTARIAFIEGQPVSISSYDFDARQSRASAAISIAAQEIAAWLPAIAKSYHELKLKLEKCPAVWQAVVGEIDQQIKELLGPEALRAVPWQWLKEYPRYLRAAKARLDKLASGGLPKDAKLSQPIQAYRQRFRQLGQSPRRLESQYAQQLDQLRWMIEEFTVSQFAQTLGTRLSVSAKRIDEQLEKLV
jgi:ATP-dependent helicase HrpA